MSPFIVYVTPEALQEIKDLPGNVRQRVKRAIESLALNPYPPQSKALNVPELDRQIVRLRLEKWRIVYAVTEDE